MNVDKNKYPQVIVRAWGGEPVKLFLHRIENNRCYVGNEYTNRPIGLLFYDVFAFDSHRFSTMRQAYESGKVEILAKIYASLSVDDFACNRYQDNVEWPHGKETITDSGCAAGRDNQ